MALLFGVVWELSTNPGVASVTADWQTSLTSGLVPSPVMMSIFLAFLATMKSLLILAGGPSVGSS